MGGVLKVCVSDDDTSTAGLRNATKPWKGVVITFTGVEEKVSYSYWMSENNGLIRRYSRHSVNWLNSLEQA